jgi:hypothetical protein
MEDFEMRKFHLVSAIALGALMAGCAQTGETAKNAEFCSQLSQDAFLQAVDQGQCELDVTTAAGGPAESEKTFGHDGSDHGGEEGDGDDGKEPDPEPDPESGTEGGETRGGQSTEPGADIP